MMRNTSSTPLSLALQGGGAHGAFTWGVLDALLERGVPMAGLSGASAGAINATLVAHGLAEGGMDGARTALDRFWRATAQSLPAAAHLPPSEPGDAPTASPLTQWLMQWTQWLSPVQLNPWNLNPLRESLREQIDFERLRATPGPALLVAATDASTGQLRLFRRHTITLEGLLASTCLPTIAQPVLIDARAHWDGAFSANPVLWPLLREAQAHDLLLVTLSPLSSVPVAEDAPGIARRINEIAMTASFLREARLIAELQAEARAHWWARWMSVGLNARLCRLRWHWIGGGEVLADLPGESRLLPEAQFVLGLRDRGREHTAAWWAAHAGKLGRRSSFDALHHFGEVAAAAV
jgi:NTE family protein